MNREDLKTAGEYGQFTVRARKEFEARYREEITGLFQYVQTLMSILGIIAGFGFTAFGYIKSSTLFFMGEILVIGSILFLVFKVKGYMLGQPMSTENQMNFYSEKSCQIKSAIIDNDAEKVSAFATEFKESIKNTSAYPKIETTKVVSGALGISLWCSIIGIIFIVSSFFICF